MKKKKRSTETAVEAVPKEVHLSEIEKASITLLEAAEQTKLDAIALYPHMLDKEGLEDAQKEAESLRRATSNLSKALAQTYSLSDELNARCKDIGRQEKKHRFIPATPANASIDLSESSAEHFAKGLNIYKMLLVCFIGSFVGVVIELLWCLITNGYVESRSGLVYGPFNLLYGAGAIALTFCLYKFRNRGTWLSFAGGTIVGSAVEYICSWGQEVLLGTRSWDYSSKPFNINGRICLLYSVFWGFLGVLWIKNLYPRIAKLILKIPNRAGKVITWVLAVFFVFNALMSVVSVYRWSERAAGAEPSNAFEVFLDERFPDKRMERIYANMKFSENGK